MAPSDDRIISPCALASQPGSSRRWARNLPLAKTEATGLSDEEFLRQFEDCTLAYAHWTHRAHLRVAYLYLARFGLAGAIPKVTAGIRAFNQAKGIVDTPTGGYHETMTVAWLHLVAAMLAESGPTGAVSPGSPPLLGPDAPPSLEFLEAQPQLREKKLLRLYYSRARFGSPEAKYSFVLPDLAPLPGGGRETAEVNCPDSGEQKKPPLLMMCYLHVEIQG